VDGRLDQLIEHIKISEYAAGKVAGAVEEQVKR
jgi:hypothetical protein